MELRELEHSVSSLSSISFLNPLIPVFMDFWQ